MRKLLLLFLVISMLWSTVYAADEYTDRQGFFGGIISKIVRVFKSRPKLKSIPTPQVTYQSTATPDKKQKITPTPTPKLTQPPLSKSPKSVATSTPPRGLVEVPSKTPQLSFLPQVSVQPSQGSGGQTESTPIVSVIPLPVATLVTQTPAQTPEALVKVQDIKNLIVYWNFDEGSGVTINDSTINGINGRIWNITESDAWKDPGRVGKALELDGYDDYINIESLPAVNLGTESQNYSISVWIKRNGSPLYESGIISKNDGSGRYPLAMTIQKDGRVSFHLYDGTTVAKVTSDPVADNQWKHIVAVKDGANKQLKLYINSKMLPVADDTTKGSLKNDDLILIGKYPFGDGSFYHDSFVIDDVRIYGTALTNGEVKALYDFGNSKVSILSFLLSFFQKALSF